MEVSRPLMWNWSLSVRGTPCRGPNGFLILFEIFVKLLCSFKCNVEGDFEKYVWLAECHVGLFVEHKCSLTSWCAYAARFEYAVTTFIAVREPLLVRSTISWTSSLVMNSVSSSKRSSMNCPAMLRVAWLFLNTDSGKIQSSGIMNRFSRSCPPWELVGLLLLLRR